MRRMQKAQTETGFGASAVMRSAESMLVPSLRHLAFSFFLVVFAGCGGALRTVGSPPHVEVPPDSAVYTTSTGSSGVRGGASASDAEDFLEAELASRADEAEPDARLAAVAAWTLRAAYDQQSVSTEAATEAAYRFGFAGMLLGYVAGPLEQERTKASLRGMIGQVPKNMLINRYGIVAGQGSDVVIVIGSVETEFDDFSRSVAPGGKLRLDGEIDDRYQRASVFFTDPAGSVRELPMKDREVDATIEFPEAGRYRLEVMGYGSTGPVVLMNVPIQVGAPVHESSSSGEADPNLTAEEAEATLLVLLNEERKKRGLGEVAADAELRAVALAHTLDMTEHSYMAHVSPTTGTPDDRAKKANLRLSRLGECIALEVTPAGAHRGLMESPAHRAAMIDPLFTHVGIGVSFTDSVHGGRRLMATLLFGRRPAPEEIRLTDKEVLELVQGLRKKRNLPALRVDPVLTAVAGAGARALTQGTAKTGPDALAAAGREMQVQVNRTRKSRQSCQTYLEIIDRVELEGIQILSNPEVTHVGLGLAVLDDAIGPKLAVIVLADAGSKQAIKCQ